MAEDILETEFETAEEVVKDRDRDLGFGSVVAEGSRQRFINRDGSFNVKRAGLNVFTSLNLYHYLLSMTWRTFLGLVLVLFFVSNVAFGIVYASFGTEEIIDTSGHPFANMLLTGFFFSVQTFATLRDDPSGGPPPKSSSNNRVLLQSPR
ncbi:MAG: hypothetical protein ABI999_09885 [Acidobacteriota bacterium]